MRDVAGFCYLLPTSLNNCLKPGRIDKHQPFDLVFISNTKEHSGWLSLLGNDNWAGLAFLQICIEMGAYVCYANGLYRYISLPSIYRRLTRFSLIAIAKRDRETEFLADVFTLVKARQKLGFSE